MTLTKEWLLTTIAELEEERDAVPGVVNEDAANALVAMKLALASLEAKPVTQVLSSRAGNDTSTIDKALPEGTMLYNALPAPVSVPDGYRLQPISEYDAMCAAMLQGAEPVMTANKLSFEQWLSQQTGTIDVECGCVMTEVFFHWLRVAYEAGNSPHCREILNSSTKNFRENAETSTKCWCRTCRPVTFADSHFVVCPECGNKRCPHANDHRNACTGSNEPGQEGSAYPAAPRQEVK
ncbi:hypothetical protein [Enterobacter cloacae complex sp. 418I7]|uniref:hypothetical protein n=1 Tax=Enterobacter cloacae complex sp. 418I7 TaxID=3395839 RepID=UPI003CEC94CE